MKAEQAELRKLLESDAQPLPIRQGAARALNSIGAPSGEPVPMLIVELNGEQAIAQVKSIPVWQEMLREELTLDLVAIPGGEFLMGSPADEEGRDQYEFSRPELKGADIDSKPPKWVALALSKHLVYQTCTAMSGNGVWTTGIRPITGHQQMEVPG